MQAEAAKLDKLLSKFQDCDLNEYDQDFVDDMVKRLEKDAHRIVLTARQAEHLERMKGRYHVD